MQIDLTFEQILSMVKQLSSQEKMKLTQELEKEGIKSKLELLLKSFKTKDLNLDVINRQVEIVRQEIYDKQKGQSNI